MPIHLDEGRRPLYIATLVAPVTEVDVRGYLARSDAALASGEKYALVIETRALDTLDDANRQLFGQWIKTRADAIRQLCVGQAYATESVMARMILRSVFLIARLPAPHVVVKTRQEGVEWCQARLREAGIALPRRSPLR